jgi:hypothetical protein
MSRREDKVAKCRDCEQEIVFGWSEKLEKWMPFDAKKVWAAHFEHSENSGKPIAKPVKVHISHFDTCPKQDKSGGKKQRQKKPKKKNTEPDWNGKCEICGETPIVPDTGMCGPCTFGEASTAGGNW